MYITSLPPPRAVAVYAGDGYSPTSDFLVHIAAIFVSSVPSRFRHRPAAVRYFCARFIFLIVKLCSFFYFLLHSLITNLVNSFFKTHLSLK